MKETPGQKASGLLTVKDQTGCEVTRHAPAKRIVSLVPSQTELLHALGLEEEVVGITKFCVHPDAWFRQKTRVGGTKVLHLDKILALKPDLVIANKEENLKEDVDALRKEVPVWVSDVHNRQTAYEMIETVGQLTGRLENAEGLVKQIQSAFDELAAIENPKPAAYLIWKEPLMTVGGDVFISDMMNAAGFANAFKHQDRYPQVSLEDLKRPDIDIILLSSEPYPFREFHARELEAATGKKTILVDGEMFSWYGSRMLQAPAYFKALREQVAAIS